MCSLVEDNARKSITDKGSASDDSLEGDKKESVLIRKYLLM